MRKGTAWWLGVVMSVVSSNVWAAIPATLTRGDKEIAFSVDFGAPEKMPVVKEQTLTVGEQSYVLKIAYKKLPPNRSFPGNLDITLLDSEGKKLGYLFFALNATDFLVDMGVFGMQVTDGNEIIDLRFTPEPKRTGKITLKNLVHERFVQDTLIPSKGFQMIRPVTLQAQADGGLSKTFALDSHPMAINYSLFSVADGVVEFHSRLLAQPAHGEAQLLQAIYFQADSLAVLREAMYAAKYFDPSYGAIKHVFYPALGQTEPSR